VISDLFIKLLLPIATGVDGNAKNAKNDNGWTPLKFAVNMSHGDDIADLLRKQSGKTRKELKAAGN
jgi:ankyrin repeat protein